MNQRHPQSRHTPHGGSEKTDTEKGTRARKRKRAQGQNLAVESRPRCRRSPPKFVTLGRAHPRTVYTPSASTPRPGHTNTHTHTHRVPSAPCARRAAPQMLGALRAPCASKFVSHGMPRDVARGGVDLRLMLVPHLVLQLSHGGLPWRFLRAFRREEDAHEPHQHAQPHETPRWKESALKARCAYQSREWPRYDIWLASVAQAHTQENWPGLARVRRLRFSGSTSRRGILSTNEPHPVPPLSCWSVSGCVQQT